MSLVIASTTVDVLLTVFSGAWLPIWVVVATAWLAGWWQMFKKAGQPAWHALIPGYNVYILFKIIGWHWAWIGLFLLPGVNLVFSLYVARDLAKSYGKDLRFAVMWLWLFNFAGYLILGYGDAHYRGHGHRM